jgi:hypothetical protein
MRKRIVLMVVVALVMAAMMALAGAAVAGASATTLTSAQEEEVVTVEVGPRAKLIEDGRAVRVMVKVTCEPEPVDHILESLLFVQQVDAYGEGFLRSVVCDGKTHVHMEEVEALGSTFHTGEAFVSAFVLVCLDGACAETAQGQETRLVRIVGS